MSCVCFWHISSVINHTKCTKGFVKSQGTHVNDDLLLQPSSAMPKPLSLAAVNAAKAAALQASADASAQAALPAPVPMPVLPAPTSTGLLQSWNMLGGTSCCKL